MGLWNRWGEFVDFIAVLNNLVKFIVNGTVKICLLESFSISDQSDDRSKSHQSHLDRLFFKFHSIDFVNDGLFDCVEPGLISVDWSLHATTDINAENQNLFWVVSFLFVLIAFWLLCLFNQETRVFDWWRNMRFCDGIVKKTKFTNPYRVSSFKVFEESLFLFIRNVWVWLKFFVLSMGEQLGLWCQNRFTVCARNKLSLNSMLFALGLIVKLDRELLIVDNGILMIWITVWIWEIGLVSFSCFMDWCWFSGTFLGNQLFSRHHLDEAFPCCLFGPGHSDKIDFIIESDSD